MCSASTAFLPGREGKKSIHLQNICGGKTKKKQKKNEKQVQTTQNREEDEQGEVR